MDSKRLLGYTFALSTGKETRNRDELLTLRVETSLLCNMKCKYCAWNSGYALEDEINFDTLKRFIAEGKDMGIQSAVIIGGGEPTIYKHFKELVEYIVELELIPVVITNGLTMDHTLASFLFNKKCSVLLKCDSLCKHTQDFLSGIEGAYEKIQSGLKDLLDCGFAVSTNNELRMGISFVVTSKNIDEIPDIWR
ncbi:MAG: radical SAM protein, partial [Candidatus Bathyarchaeota archaeon]|uniref:radical SAM protein n=1 Tax=Candidatus Bathycorpusculum sp. TaxID=2994959 RepID=UPI0028374270|nr:radical SAM protein [Candidatus Termiticorpusculum sp.]